jgi:hypothetical protein
LESLGTRTSHYFNFNFIYSTIIKYNVTEFSRRQCHSPPGRQTRHSIKSGISLQNDSGQFTNPSQHSWRVGKPTAMAVARRTAKTQKMKAGTIFNNRFLSSDNKLTFAAQLYTAILYTVYCNNTAILQYSTLYTAILYTAILQYSTLSTATHSAHFHKCFIHCIYTQPTLNNAPLKYHEPWHCLTQSH